MVRDLVSVFMTRRLHAAIKVTSGAKAHLSFARIGTSELVPFLFFGGVAWTLVAH